MKPAELWPSRTWRRVVFLAMVFLCLSPLSGQEELSTRLTKEVVQAVFEAHHDGWSLDEVMLDDNRRSKIIEAVRKEVSDADEKEVWELLIKLRKAGKLNAKTTERSNTEYGESLFAAEIAARKIQDETGVPFDRVLIDPVLLKRYDEAAQEVDAKHETYVLRKAALKLRKSRQLKPELVLRVTDWKRTIETMSVKDAAPRVQTISTRPGIYIFRDETGYLYIGQSNNLRERLTKHLADSDRKALAQYLASHAEGNLILELHIFEKGSPAEQTIIREAYESELIRSRKPRLNIAP